MLLVMTGEFSIRRQLFWAFGYAAGLSALSFSAALQKDAASIPNALGRLKINFQLKKSAGIR